MSAAVRLGAACAALLAAACTSTEPGKDPSRTRVECEHQVSGRGRTYGVVGDPSPVERKCEAREIPPPLVVEPPEGVVPDPNEPRSVIEAE